MFKKILAIAATALITSTAFAADPNPELEFTLVSVSDKMVVGKTTPNLAAKKDAKKIFVVVEGKWGKVYKQTTQITKDILIKDGYSIAEEKEKADVIIAISGTSFDMDEVETNVDSGINKGRLAEVIGGAIITGGISLIGEAWHPASGENKSVVISTTFVETLNVDGKETKNVSVVSSTLSYKSNKNGAEVANAVYLSFLSQLIKNNLNRSEVVATDKVAQVQQQ